MVIGDYVGWRSAQRELEQSSVTRVRPRKVQKCASLYPLAWLMREPVASETSSREALPHSARPIFPDLMF
jgi:hypothetical protein